jgi:hypothetical protein
MEAIKKYLAGWDLSRIIRLVLGVAMGIGYLSTKESLYLIGGLILTGQAVFNISCPGGACTTPMAKDDKKPVMTFEKLETKDKKDV